MLGARRAGVIGALALVITWSAGALVQVDAAGDGTTGNPKSPGVSVILPPGQSGSVSWPAFAQNQADGNCADFGPHFCDRLSDYLAWRWDADPLRTSGHPLPGDRREDLRSGRVRILRDAATRLAPRVRPARRGN